MENVEKQFKITEEAVVRCLIKVFSERFKYDYSNINAPINFSAKLKNTLGYVKINFATWRIEKICFSKELLSGHLSIQSVESVIIHEALHAYLFKIRKPFKDNDRYFTMKAREYGASLTNEIRKNAGYSLYCAKCDKRLALKNSEKVALRYHNSDDYYSKCCKAKIVYKGYEVFEDKTIIDYPDSGKLLTEAIKFVDDKNKEVRNRVAVDTINKAERKINKIKTEPKETKSGIKIDVDTKLIMSNSGKLSINQTTLWRSINYYCDNDDYESLKFLKKNFEEMFEKGYKCITNGRKKKVDKLLLL